MRRGFPLKLQSALSTTQCSLDLGREHLPLPRLDAIVSGEHLPLHLPDVAQSLSFRHNFLSHSSSSELVYGY